MSPSPLMLQAVMSLVNGSAAAQPGSSSSFRLCAGPSFKVTTQVLLRSVVESSHCPIMSFLSALASCACTGEVETSNDKTNAVIASEAKQSSLPAQRLDCFVAALLA